MALLTLPLIGCLMDSAGEYETECGDGKCDLVALERSPLYWGSCGFTELGAFVCQGNAAMTRQPFSNFEITVQTSPLVGKTVAVPSTEWEEWHKSINLDFLGWEKESNIDVIFSAQFSAGPSAVPFSDTRTMNPATERPSFSSGLEQFPMGVLSAAAFEGQTAKLVFETSIAGEKVFQRVSVDLSRPLKFRTMNIDKGSSVALLSAVIDGKPYEMEAIAIDKPSYLVIDMDKVRLANEEELTIE